MRRREFLQATAATLGLAAANTSFGLVPSLGIVAGMASIGFLAGGTPLDGAVRDGLTAVLGRAGGVVDISLPAGEKRPNVQSLAETLGQQPGTAVVAVLKADQCWCFDEALFEARAKLLYRGHHMSDGSTKSVRHDVMELPASFGIASVFSEDQAWPNLLGLATGLVASRNWTGVLPENLRGKREMHQPLPSQYALSTYVIML